MRGDDIFTPTDILEDIWQGINGSDFIVADITGRNPNMLYELGIAHTSGKPVLILTQSADDVPIDLGTRRMLIYGDAVEGGPRVKTRPAYTRGTHGIRLGSRELTPGSSRA